MPRVNLSTTNKATRDVNLTFMEQQTSGHGASGSTTQQNKQLKKMGMLVNNYFDQQEHAIEPKSVMLQNSGQQHESQLHKRMQSLVTDP
mmetsp:Transcript_8728/g.10786  ORF Transcript_8728/g.10786 Transcript_8728/m.10786 type:complete len:89 (+) Transcript_8728:214-480(+)